MAMKFNREPRVIDGQESPPNFDVHHFGSLLKIHSQILGLPLVWHAASADFLHLGRQLLGPAPADAGDRGAGGTCRLRAENESNSRWVLHLDLPRTLEKQGPGPWGRISIRSQDGKKKRFWGVLGRPRFRKKNISAAVRWSFDRFFSSGSFFVL